MKFLALVFFEHLQVETTHYTGVDVSVFIIRTNFPTLATPSPDLITFGLGAS